MVKRGDSEMKCMRLMGVIHEAMKRVEGSEGGKEGWKMTGDS